MMPAPVPVQVPATKGKRSLRHLTASDKINAIQRFHDGESKASVARDIGVAESTFRGWCKKEEKLRHMSNNAAIDNNLKVDKSADKMNGDSDLAAAAALYSGPPEKRAKLDASLNFASSGKSRYEDMNFKSRNSMGALDLSNIDKGLGGLHYNGIGSNNYTGYKPSTEVSTNGRINCEDTMLRGFGADIKPSQLSGMFNLNPAALGLSDTSNLNLIAKLNNQWNIAGLSNSQKQLTYGLRTVRPKQMSQRSTVKNVKILQHKNPTKTVPGQQRQQTMLPSTSTSATPPPMSHILNELNSNSCWYFHRMKEIANAILNNNSNCSTGNTPEDLSKLKKTELELENESEVNETSANSPLTSPKAELSEDNTDRKAALDNILDNNNNDNVVSNESDCKGLLMTGLELADKFQQFLEAYHGDPTVTGFDLLQFRTLHNKLKKTAERIRIENT